MKKAIYAAIVGAVALSLTACSAAENKPVGSSTEPQSSEASSEVASDDISDGQAKTDEHVDEFTMVEAHKKQSETDKKYGYFELVITAKNNTDQPLRLRGIKLSELDENGNIINSYSSENKNAVDAIVESGQQISIPLTCSEEDGIAGVQCTGYAYEDADETTEGDFSEIFKQMF